jgi:hypothetical protein
MFYAGFLHGHLEVWGHSTGCRDMSAGVSYANSARVDAERAVFVTSEATLLLQNVPYVFVPSKAALGRACGVTRPVCSFAFF